MASSTVRIDSATKTLSGWSGRPETASWAHESRTSAASPSRRSTIEPTTRRSAGCQRRRENASEVDRIRRRSLTWVLSVRMFAIIVAEQAFDMQADVLTCGRPGHDQLGPKRETQVPASDHLCPNGGIRARAGRLGGEDAAQAGGPRLSIHA